MSVCQRRNTRQRQVVLSTLCEMNSHPTAGELYRLVRDKLPRISLGTVYRNLEILQETGQAVRLAGCNGQEARYDGRTEPHLHFHCRQCQAIFDLATKLPLLDDLLDKTIEGHRTDGYHLILHGTCLDCRGRD